MRNATRFPSGRDLDVICLGRMGVDFYAQQIGARLEDVTSFAKYLGGSSANTAFGCARLGLKAGMISRVGDDAMGRFLVETIAREGCDVSHVGVDPARLTAAVVLGIKDKDTFPLIFLRENCADMAIGEAEIEASYIARSRALLITGTHFSTEYINRISNRALERAHEHDVRTVLDIDYRPVLWGLTKRGDGETRYIQSDTVTAHLARLLPKFDLVIGTIEEFNIAGGSTDIMESLTSIRRNTKAVLVVKRGPLGCAVIDGAIPRSLDDAFNGSGVEVEVLNVLGAGDAFSAGFLSGWVRGEDYDACALYANACGALVVSRHGCAPAMPTRIELDYFIANAAAIPRPDQDATLSRLHRVTAPRTPRERAVRIRVRSSESILRAGAASRRGRGAHFAAQAIICRCACRHGTGTWRPSRSHRHPVRRSLRSGRAERRDGTGMVDWPTRGIARLESACVRPRPLDRHGTDRMAARARRQVSRSVPSRRCDRESPRAGSADSRTLRRRAGERSRIVVGNHFGEVAAAGGRYRLSCAQTSLQRRHFIRSGGSSSR
jgi:5-dehydro-2-deoxygluconokinase